MAEEKPAHEFSSVQTEPSPARPNKAIVVVSHGLAFCVTHDIEEYIREMLAHYVGDDEGFSIERSGGDCPKLGDGVWTVSVRLADDGPGDAPGTREFIVKFYDKRPTTKEEWTSYCDGEWPWDREVVTP